MTQIPKFHKRSFKETKSGQLIIYIRLRESNSTILPCNIDKLVHSIQMSGQINTHRNQHALNLSIFLTNGPIILGS